MRYTSPYEFLDSHYCNSLYTFHYNLSQILPIRTQQECLPMPLSAAIAQLA